MFDIGWQEVLVIAVVALVVIGPKDLPKVLKTVMAGMGKLRHMAQEFRSGIDEVIREAEIDDLKRHLEKTASADIGSNLKAEVDPTGRIEKELKALDTSMPELPAMPPRKDHDQ